MKCSLKRMMLLLAVLLTVNMPLQSVHAESVVKDGVSVTVSTDKDSYAPGETVKVNLLLKNGSGAELKNVTMENLTPAGCVMVPGTSAVKELPTLANNGQVTLASSFQVEKDIVPPKTGDDTPIFLWVSLALLSGCLLFALKKIGAKRTITMLLVFVLTASLLPVELAQADTALASPKQLTVKKNVAIKGVPTEVRSQVTYGMQEMSPDDEGALFYKEPAPEHIIHDDARDIYYVDNQILLVAKDGTPQAQVKALVESYGGTIVGMIALTDDYQAEFKQAMTYKELEELCGKLQASSIIYAAQIHIYYETVLNGNEFIPNDQEWDSEWNTNGKADGKNWGVEAIQAPAAWNYRNIMSTVNVGVFDAMFDKNHEDLSFAKVLNNPASISNGHGTHVSGIIGSKFNNAKGIAGVAPKVNLYGYATGGDNLSSVMEYKQGLMELVTDKCRIINISMGADTGKWSAADSDFNKSLDEFITKLVKHGYDFLIVKSAGNNGTELTNNDYFSGCTQNRDRILVVGAMDRNGALANYSNRGSRVDLVAPGSDIYSTWLRNSYQYENGTSMAAAFVSGVAAMCYSVNPNLTASQVKKTLCNSINETISGNYGVLNAKLAVEKTLTDAGMTIINEDETVISLGGKVTAPDGSPLAGVKVTISKDENGADIVTSASTNDAGMWSVTNLPSGVDYYATFTMDGYSFNNPVKNPKPGDTAVIGTLTESNSGFTFDNDSNTICMITGYTGDESNIVIPTTDPRGRRVVGIGIDAFTNNKKFTSVRIPDVQSFDILPGAFWGCSNLTSIYIPKNVYLYEASIEDVG